MPQDKKSLIASYDRLAAQYVQKFNDELDHKSLDRELLTRFADSVRDQGPVCDLGCGPGQIARFLHGCGLDVFGLDLSPVMLQQARQLNPQLEFRQGDMYALAEASDSLAGIVAFYSIIHVPRDKVTAVLRELLRVLKPGGKLLMSFHLGDEDIHLDELWDVPVRMDAAFFERAEMEEYVLGAGFEIEDIVEREPYPDVEYESQRAYFFAKKPGEWV
jgi:SAM-dependent methyltransferase